jgi:hypothetical protein
VDESRRRRRDATNQLVIGETDGVVSPITGDPSRRPLVVRRGSCLGLPVRREDATVTRRVTESSVPLWAICGTRVRAGGTPQGITRP